ncbi:hypothetical protein DBV15_08578 [Temnothorax longispinosus]|uniref:Uncharacterized protein n=1 Tax=Temnothorax longispinosus TaxID=300112 RepID=A0A4S2KYK6_9HYME|nr:hypothetical protein DBV15_08578 [Temnothorax longispinosus]
MADSVRREKERKRREAQRKETRNGQKDNIESRGSERGGEIPEKSPGIDGQDDADQSPATVKKKKRKHIRTAYIVHLMALKNVMPIPFTSEETNINCKRTDFDYASVKAII